MPQRALSDPCGKKGAAQNGLCLTCTADRVR
jgi:hypothetical protein